MRFVIAGILLSAGALLGAQTPRAARLAGVFDEDTGAPLEGVRITELLSGTFATTTSTGTVALTFLRDGGSMVRLQKLGYQMQTLFVAVSPADTAPLTILFKRVTELPAVVTRDSAPAFRSPALRGFDERRHDRAGGYFLGEAELRAKDNSTVANVVRALPGMKVLDGRGASWLLPTARCNDGTHAGPPAVYLDGVAWTPPARADTPHVGRKDDEGAAFDLNEFQVYNLAAIEYYPDNTVLPAGLTHSATRCGAIFLWTRER